MTTKTILTCDFCGAVAVEGDRHRWFVLQNADKLVKDVCSVCVERLRGSNPSFTYVPTYQRPA